MITSNFCSLNFRFFCFNFCFGSCIIEQIIIINIITTCICISLVHANQSFLLWQYSLCILLLHQQILPAQVKQPLIPLQCCRNVRFSTTTKYIALEQINKSNVFRDDKKMFTTGFGSCSRNHILDLSSTSSLIRNSYSVITCAYVHTCSTHVIRKLTVLINLLFL